MTFLTCERNVARSIAACHLFGQVWLIFSFRLVFDHILAAGTDFRNDKRISHFSRDKGIALCENFHHDAVETLLIREC